MVAVSQGKIYAVGGHDAGVYFNRVAEYDTALNSWVTKAPMADSRSGGCAVTVNDLIYVIGGIDTSGYLGTVEVYDPSNNTWLNFYQSPVPFYHEFFTISISI